MDFENRIKADFRNDGQKWAVDVGIDAEFPEAGIEDGYMIFSNEEILQCFEPVMNRILELVRNQIIAIEAQNRPLKVSSSARNNRAAKLTDYYRTFLLLEVSEPLNTFFNKSNSMYRRNINLKLSVLWTLWQQLLKVLSLLELLKVLSHIVSHVDIILWLPFSPSKKVIIQSNIVSRV
jgi:hypothetical protein